MFSSTNPTKRTILGAFGPAAGIVAACMSFSSVAFADGGDECASATTAVVGANTFTTVGKTASANPPADTLCPGTYLDWQTSADCWFVFNTGGPGTLDLTTCLAGSYDTSIALYSGTCAGLTLVACNGDGPADAACQNFYSSLQYTVTSGGDYYVRIGGWQGATGAGTLTLGFTPVSYASCLTSTDPCGVVHAGDGCSDPVCCSNVCSQYPPCCGDSGATTGWEQLCVDLAVDACGIFIYSCTAPAYSNDCATSPMIVNDNDVKAYNTAGANTDGGPCDCNSGKSDVLVWHDLWYRFVAPANGAATFSNCFSGGFDSKIALYHIPAGPVDGSLLPSEFVACNEDCTDPAFTSELTATVDVGENYLVRLGGYLDASGAGNITFNLPDPCVLPATGGSEGEPCGDEINSGCVDGITESSTLPLNTAIAGNFWTTGGLRDVDTYKMTITVPSTVTVEVWSASNVVTNLLSGDMCGSLQLLANGSGSCPRAYTYCLNPGVYYVQTAIDTTTFEGTPCDSGVFNNYVIKATTTPSVCPVLLGTTCSNPGPDNKTLNNGLTITNFVVQCGANPVTAGNSAEAWFARSFPASMLTAGQIQCVSFGFAAIHYTSTTTYVASDIPVTGSLSVYSDNDGGAPVNVAGASQDLTLLSSVAFSAPGGTYVATVTFDTPICLTGNTKNIVVVCHVDSPTVGTGYWARMLSNNLGPANDNYVMFPACGATYTNFVIFNSANSWIVNLNGNFTTCGTPCPEDFNGDGSVDGADLGALLGAWGACSCPQDLNGDGNVDGADLGQLLGAWGPC